jgi:hypothetical protein
VSHSYTVSSTDEIRYAVVGADVDVPERHRGPLSADGTRRVVIRRRDEDPPVDAAWLTVEELREIQAASPEVWREDLEGAGSSG